MLMAALPLSLASCAEELEYTPGEPDLENCYGVYFPEQENSGSHQLDPSDPTTLTFTAARLNSEDAITVPVEVSANYDGIFTVSEITFEDGQEETQFTVSFDSADVGVTYECTVEVNDPQYALVYGTNPTYLTFSLSRIKWNKLEATNGLNGKWRDDIFSSFTNFNLIDAIYVSGGRFAEKDVDVYERDDMPGYYRIDNVYTQDYVESMLITDLMGDTTTNYYGTLKDGVITFPAEGVLMNKAVDGNSWYPSNSSGMLRIVLPGYAAVDYSLLMTASLSENGQLPLSVTLGADVAKVRYSTYEGSLTEEEIDSKAKEIINNGEPNVKEFNESGTYALSFEKTGVYTIVGVVYDSSDTQQGYSSTSFKYVAAGEEVPVVLTTGLVVSDKYAPQGYTSENSMEFYVYGKDISVANMTLFKSSYIAGADPEVIKSVMLSEAAVEDTELSAEQVTTINGNGLSGVFTGLNPNEDYTLAVYASNGYEETMKLVSAKTEGESDPLQITYGMDDIKADLLPATAEGYFGEWNFYAIDGFDDAVVGPSVNNRVSVGKVTISDSAEEDTPGDDYISVKGLVGPSAANYGISDDTFTFSYYNGVVYTLANTLPQAQSGYYPVLMHAIGEQVGTVDYAMIGAYVDESHVAFMDVTGMGIDNLYLGMFADADYTQFGGGAVYWIDPLLVKPEASTSSAPKAKVSKGELKAIGTRFISSMNYVETPEGRIKSAIDEILSQPVRVVPMEIAKNVQVNRDVTSVDFKVEKVSTSSAFVGDDLKARIVNAVPVRLK